jgi:predicted ATPase
MVTRTDAPIRTPDQHLRVFVSSTLRELAAERAVVRTAIERMRLAPVMFELGARPHPPRDLYRAYLAQSDVFVGIYGDSYGWVAPEEEISGLEDEYRLAPPAMPKLIYLTRSPAREPRLEELIDRIRADDTASYKEFSTTGELAELVAGDLATLLAERFDASRPAQASPADAAPAFAGLPTPYTRLIGRDDDVDAVLAAVTAADARLVTLVGPGGIGKSRLAIAVADRARDRFPGGVAFVSLENVWEPDLLLPTIASALGVRDTGEVALTEKLALTLADRRMLLVLDNLEQLADSAARLVDLYALAPHAVLLATSRVVLRIRGERVHDLAPLRTHDAASPDSVRRAATSPAVELFVERARAVQPSFALTAENTAAVVEVCRMLDGLPLAIELAAARVRVLPPAAMLQRLDRQLPLLVDSSRDLPPRQRTLRSTIEWSTGLLGETERAMLADLGVFSQGFTLEAVEALGDGRVWADTALDALGVLVDSSLVATQDSPAAPVFTLLVSVREWAIGNLRDSGDEDRMRRRHAEVYTQLARREAPRLTGAEQPSAVARLTLERGNLRTAVRHLVLSGDVDTAADVAWALFLFWWIGGYLGEVAVWMRDALERRPDAPPRTRAIATFSVCWHAMWPGTTPGIPERMIQAAEWFATDGDAFGQAMATATAGIAQASSGDPDLDTAHARLEEGRAGLHAAGAAWAEVLCTVALGRIAWARGDNDRARAWFQEGRRIAASGGEALTGTIVGHHLARALLFGGSVDEAGRVFAQTLGVSVELGHDEGIAFSLEGLSAVAVVRGDADRAGVLAGAAEAIRARTGAVDTPAFVFHTGYLARLPDQDAVAEAVARGRDYGAGEAAAYALAGA